MITPEVAPSSGLPAPMRPPRPPIAPTPQPGRRYVCVLGDASKLRSMCASKSGGPLFGWVSKGSQKKTYHFVGSPILRPNVPTDRSQRFVVSSIQVRAVEPFACGLQAVPAVLHLHMQPKHNQLPSQQHRPQARVGCSLHPRERANGRSPEGLMKKAAQIHKGGSAKRPNVAPWGPMARVRIHGYMQISKPSPQWRACPSLVYQADQKWEPLPRKTRGLNNCGRPRGPSRIHGRLGLSQSRAPLSE